MDTARPRIRRLVAGLALIVAATPVALSSLTALTLLSGCTNTAHRARVVKPAPVATPIATITTITDIGGRTLVEVPLGSAAGLQEGDLLRVSSDETRRPFKGTLQVTDVRGPDHCVARLIALDDRSQPLAVGDRVRPYDPTAAHLDPATSTNNGSTHPADASAAKNAATPKSATDAGHATATTAANDVPRPPSDVEAKLKSAEDALRDAQAKLADSEERLKQANDQAAASAVSVTELSATLATREEALDHASVEAAHANEDRQRLARLTQEIADAQTHVTELEREHVADQLARLEAERALYELSARVLRLPADAPETAALQARVRKECAASGTVSNDTSARSAAP